jgi:hypothetical protein
MPLSGMLSVPVLDETPGNDWSCEVNYFFNHNLINDVRLKYGLLAVRKHGRP